MCIRDSGQASAGAVSHLQGGTRQLPPQRVHLQAGQGLYDLSLIHICVDVRDWDRAALRGEFAMVLQDTWLFNGTIRENSRYGRPDASDAEVEAAARAARCDHFIHTLAGGYDFMINEEGTNLSQGQRQLVTIRCV